MKIYLVISLFLVACGDNLTPDVYLLGLDAGIDAAPPACTREPSTDGCCALLPDEDAVRQCAIDGVSGEPGACGVVVCWQANCELTRINFCIPIGDRP